MGRKSGYSEVVTSVLHTIQAQFNLPRLRQGASVPKIILKNNASGKTYDYPLLGESYVIGRNRLNCDIVIANPIISQVHCAIERNKNQRRFQIKDLKSTNGIYLGKRRYQNLTLRHNDVITLGPPELADVIELSFQNPPAPSTLVLRYGLFILSGWLLIILLTVGILWSQYEVNPLPYGNTGATVVYGEDGKTPLSPRVTTPHRELANLKDFSPYLPQALMASEDSRYYWHFGIDPVGILRAIVINRGGEARQGASTITQQLARSLFPSVGRENNLGRKLREMVVATKLEAVYSKNEILKAYLNRVYLGINLYGFEDAAQFYFKKSARDLTIAESATLVAVLPAPNAYNPVQDYDTALALRNRIIQRMFNLGMISEEEASSARRSRIDISPEARETLSNIIAPYFYSYVFQEMRSLLGQDLLQEGDFIIETSLNFAQQEKAEKALAQYITNNGTNYGFSQGALLTMKSDTGEITAMVGGKDYQESQFNRATQAQRQPASTFKLFVYSAAVAQGISPNKSYPCGGVRWQGVQFSPCRHFSSNVNMYQGMAWSENPVAVRVAQDVGLNQVVDMAKKMGIKSPLNAVPGLALGQSESNLLEMTGAYATIANGGKWQRPHAIKVIRDGRDCTDFQDNATCREVYRFNQDNSETRQVLNTAQAQVIQKMLQDVVTMGTGKNAYLGKGEAGKTGTNTANKDLWFIGYLPSPSLTTGIWLGNDDNSPTKGGSALSASLWAQYMKDEL
ncbi:MAG: PBP1A family penicillin-binding protein [Cyanobacterium sp. T60_A2020_053]|nr:PBP1A family penicillin-binding protein [Cyanobacterium sp. T60_A2020_053]